MADEQDKDQNWLKWGMGLGGGALIIGAGLILIPSPLDSEDEDEPAASQQQETTDDDTASPTPDEQQPYQDNPDQEDEPATGGECDLANNDDSFPTEAPDFEWQNHHGAEIPVSEEHGPADQDDEFWQCFSQTPTGATFAGIPLMLDFTLNDAHEAGEDSPATDAAFGEAQNFPEDVDVLFQGFRVNEASDDHASVTYWMTPETDPAAGDLQMTVELVWDEGADDWRLDLTRGLPDWEEAEDTSGFVRWR